MFQLLILPGAFAPALAAYLVRAFVTREGFADAGLKPGLRRWRPYAFGLLFLGGPSWIFVSYLGVFGWVPLGALCASNVLTGRLRADREQDSLPRS